MPKTTAMQACDRVLFLSYIQFFACIGALYLAYSHYRFREGICTVVNKQISTEKLSTPEYICILNVSFASAFYPYQSRLSRESPNFLNLSSAENYCETQTPVTNIGGRFACFVKGSWTKDWQLTPYEFAWVLGCMFVACSVKLIWSAIFIVQTERMRRRGLMYFPHRLQPYHKPSAEQRYGFQRDPAIGFRGFCIVIVLISIWHPISSVVSLAIIFIDGWYLLCINYWPLPVLSVTKDKLCYPINVETTWNEIVSVEKQSTQDHGEPSLHITWSNGTKQIYDGPQIYALYAYWEEILRQRPPVIPREVTVVFLPKPTDSSDVVWVRSVGTQDFTYHLHSQVLKMNSTQLCNQNGTSCEHLGLAKEQNMLAFLKLVYGDESLVTCLNVLNVWNLAIVYGCDLFGLFCMSYVFRSLAFLPCKGQYVFTINDVIRFADREGLAFLRKVSEVFSNQPHKKRCSDVLEVFDKETLLQIITCTFGVFVPEIREAKTDAMFRPEPVNASDVLWLDAEGGEYHVHSQVLSYRSPVLRAYAWTRGERFQTEHSPGVLRTFFRIVYGGCWSRPFIADCDILGVWQLLHQYGSKSEQMCCAKLLSRLVSGDLSEDSCLGLRKVLRVAHSLSAKHVTYVMETVITKRREMMSMDVLKSLEMADLHCLLRLAMRPYLSLGSMLCARNSQGDWVKAQVIATSDKGVRVASFKFDQWVKCDSDALAPLGVHELQDRRFAAADSEDEQAPLSPVSLIPLKSSYLRRLHDQRELAEDKLCEQGLLEVVVSDDARVVFRAEPVSQSDVVWRDNVGSEYRVHSQILKMRSSLFRARGVVQDNFNISPEVLKTFFQVLYSCPGDRCIVSDRNVLRVWQLLKDYRCECSTYCISWIMKRLGHLPKTSSNDNGLSIEKILESDIGINPKIVDLALSTPENNTTMLTDLDLPSLMQLGVTLGIVCSEEDKQDAMFRPEPVNASDVLWLDAEGGEYHVHSQVLGHRSPVLRAYAWTRGERFQTEHSPGVLRTFFRIVYGGCWSRPFIADCDILGVWQLLHQYGCKSEQLCRLKLISRLVSGDLSGDSCLSLRKVLRVAHALSADDVILKVFETLFSGPRDVALNVLDGLEVGLLRRLLAYYLWQPRPGSLVVVTCQDGSYLAEVVIVRESSYFVRFRGLDGVREMWVDSSCVEKKPNKMAIHARG